MKTDKDTIVAEALRLLDERGLDGLTTRALAARLGIRQPALYWHFANRQALVAAMNDAMMAGSYAQDGADPALIWQDHVLAFARAFRAALLSHRDGARVHAGTHANPAMLERHMGVLVAAGFPVPLALQLLVSTGRLIVGWVLEEQAEDVPAPEEADLPQGLAGAAIRVFDAAGETAMFEAGLQFLVTGAEVALAAARR